MTDRFYQSLPPLAWPLKEILRHPELFQAVPEDWEIIVTDVKGSTQAVAQGRYRDVNTIAASSVIACLNVARRAGVQIAFFYGGDGATLLVPSSVLEEMRGALWALRANTFASYGLVLRVGSVPVSEVQAAGSTLRMAKWSVAPGYDQAVFLGDGLAFADKRIKGDASTADVMPEAARDIDLQGLMCRWGEIGSGQPRQEIVCAMIQATPGADQAAVYAEALEALDRIYGPYAARHPVTAAALHPTVGLTGARVRSALESGRLRPWRTFRTLCRSLGSAFLFRFGLSVGSFHPETYLRSLIAATDTLHLSGTLYTMVRGTAEQRLAFRAVLDAMEHDGKLMYGTATCPASVMTCYVQKYDRGHTHFLDGAGGGYTQASKELKAKFARRS